MTFPEYYNSIDWQLTMKPMAEDMFMAGAASRDEEVRGLRAALTEIWKVSGSSTLGWKIACETLKGKVK